MGAAQGGSAPIPVPGKTPTPPGRTFVRSVPRYQPKNVANATAKSNRRIGQIELNGNVYTLQGGSEAQIRRAIANGTFSGFRKVGQDAAAKAKALRHYNPGYGGPGAPPPAPAPPPGPQPAPRDYRELGLKFGPSTPARRQRKQTLVIDIAKVEASFRQDKGFYVAPLGVNDPKPGAYDRVVEFLERASKEGLTIEMPEISADAKGQVSFTDGRHRFAVFRDLGLENLPVSVFRSEFKRLLKLFGWTEEKGDA